MLSTRNSFPAVYGPVTSWRYGRSLGIDPIGAVSTCSFRCVYCQLGEIEQVTDQRQVFIPTEQITRQLSDFAPWAVDAVTLSGSGEPTLAANLGEILSVCRELTQRPTVVLTNGTLLGDRAVRQDLQAAAKVAVKVDAIAPAAVQRLNRPLATYDPEAFWAQLAAFRADYVGELAIQTMLLAPWSDGEIASYAERLRAIAPDEVQLNAPKRPQPRQRQLDGRENHSAASARAYATRQFRCIAPERLQAIAAAIAAQSGVPVRSVPEPSPS